MGGGILTGVAGGGIKALTLGIPHGGRQGDRAAEGCPFVTERTGGRESFGHFQWICRYDLCAFLQRQTEDKSIVGIDGKYAIRFNNDVLGGAIGIREILGIGNRDCFQVFYLSIDAHGIGYRGEELDRRSITIQSFLRSTDFTTSIRYLPKPIRFAGCNSRGKGFTIVRQGRWRLVGSIGGGKGYVLVAFQCVREPPFHPGVGKGSGVMDGGVGTIEGNGGR